MASPSVACPEPATSERSLADSALAPAAEEGDAEADFDAREEEEAEARRIQSKQAARLSEGDFAFDSEDSDDSDNQDIMTLLSKTSMFPILIWIANLLIVQYQFRI